MQLEPEETKGLFALLGAAGGAVSTWLVSYMRKPPVDTCAGLRGALDKYHDEMSEKMDHLTSEVSDMRVDVGRLDERVANLEKRE